jgi:hypothetical protein
MAQEGATMTQNPLVAAIEELESNGLATRSWAEAGRLLAICERCREWDRHGCHQVDVRPGPFAVFLCDAGRRCERWG